MLPDPPSEYVQALANLKGFRSKILTELVASRIVAGLDANHDSMLKYKTIVQNLSIVPYVFGKVQESALALRLNGLDVGEGEVNKIVAIFKGGLASYPLKQPFNQPLRELPQVDIFEYVPPSDINLSEKSSEEIWGGFFTLQSDIASLKETPDVQNVFYDYYKLRGIGRARMELSLSNQETGFGQYVKLKGEATILVRSVTPQASGLLKDYDFYCFVDADFYSATALIESVPMVFVVTSNDATNPQKIVMAGGKRLESNVIGVYKGSVVGGQLVGWSKVSGGYTETVKEVLWAGMSALTLSVNDVTKGTVDPLPSISEYKATDTVIVTAYPESGFVVVRWELDGVQYPANNTFSLKMYRDHDLLCVFGTSNTIRLRPNSDVENYHVSRYTEGTNLYECVAEAISDGDATYLYDWVTGFVHNWSALFGVPSGMMPLDKIIDDVEVFVKARSPNMSYPSQIAMWIRTYGTDYVTEYVQVDYIYHTYSFKWDKNPYTGQEWTKEEIDALKFGFAAKVTVSGGLLSGNYGRTTQVWADVPYHTA